MAEDRKFNETDESEWASDELAQNNAHGYNDEVEELLSVSDFEFLRNLGIDA